MMRELVTGNPLRIGLTPSERVEHVPGTGVKTNGVGNPTTAHLNLEFSEADTHNIVRVHIGSPPKLTWKWYRRDPRRRR